MVHLGGVLCDIPIFGNISSNLAKNETNKASYLGKDFLDKQIDRFNKNT